MSEAASPDLIYDIGAHKGEDSDFYLKLGYRVVAVEANPVLASQLRERFSASIAAGTYTLINKAIAESDGEISFYINKQASVWGTINPDWAARNAGLGAESERITVESARFEDIIAACGPAHYLKADVEGADMMCVRALATVRDRPRFVSIESSKTSWAQLQDEFDTLERLGYSRFQVINQKSHPAGTFTARDGRTVQHRFEDGASGRFGEALTGPWLTRQQAERKYARIFFLYRLLGDNTPMQRLLARVPLLRKVLGIVGWYDTHAMRG